MLKHILLSLLVAALTALAAWIIAVNLYVTSKAFAHAAPGAPAAFRVGFGIAAPAGAAAFLLTLYLLRRKRAGH
ncbi:MAG TPA: hypothetical protein VL523_05620 [Terriglobia bacterium]|nr:hypothetical protein [Terriglobia bacterium]